MLRIRIDSRATLRQMKAIAGVHFPFAFAKSLTNLAQLGRDAAQENTRKRFQLHSEFIPRGITIEAAKKSDIINKARANAYVLTKPKVSEFMPIHEEGGQKRPGAFSGGHDKGRMLAIPSRWLRKQNYMTKSGRVRKKWRPSELLKHYNQLKPNQAARLRGTRKRFGPRTPFIMRSKGNSYIVRRLSGGKYASYPLQFLYYLVPEARIPERWKFHPAVELVVIQNFVQVFATNIRQALLTAR
jgi:hypothetical protein